MSESATNVMESAAVFGADVDPKENLETHQYVGADTATSYTPQTTEKVLCGWGAITPASCQRFRKPGWFLFWLCWAGALQGMVVNGYINVVISTIERRFEISSTESGAIASCYDIASVICLIPVTYFGGRGLKPAYVGIGILIMALGSFTFAVPHFTSIPYETNDTQSHMCQPEVNLTSCSTRTTGLSDYKYVFFLGQLLHGAGASPLYTLGTAYLDENLSVRSAALYQGTFYAFAIVGPAIGYLAGGAFLNINEYFTAPDTAMPSIDKNSPAWVGAWWIGFLISGVLGVLISIPLCAFPITLPGSEKYRIEHEKEVYHSKAKTESKPGIQPLGCADICFTLKLLLMNPTFMLLNLAAAFNGIIVSGFSTFAPKFIEYQFSLSSGMAAQYVGFAAIPAGGGATFLGGYLIKHFNLTVRGILKLCIVSTFIAVFFSLVFLIHCNNVPFAGVNLPYYKDNRSLGFIDRPDFLETCNADCGCSQQNYFPVCGKDGVMYYSPCYAGCLSVTGTDVKYYNNCSCIKYDSNGESWMAQQGKCESDCSWLPVFMPLFTVVMFGIFITSMPALAASLRCIPQEKRSFALGIQWIIARCLGSIPGPIIFGKIIDVTCKLWQKRCDGDGACYFYDNQNMSYNLLALGIVCVFFSALCFLFALVFYRTASSCEDSTHIDTQSVDSLSVCTNMTSLTHLSTLNGTAVTSNDAPAIPNGTSVNCNGMSATTPTIVLDAAMLLQPNSASSRPDCEYGVKVKTDVLNTFQSDVCIDRRCTAIHSFHIHL